MLACWSHAAGMEGFPQAGGAPPVLPALSSGANASFPQTPTRQSASLGTFGQQTPAQSSVSARLEASQPLPCQFGSPPYQVLQHHNQAISASHLSMSQVIPLQQHMALSHNHVYGTGLSAPISLPFQQVNTPYHLSSAMQSPPPWSNLQFFSGPTAQHAVQTDTLNAWPGSQMLPQTQQTQAMLVQPRAVSHPVHPSNTGNIGPYQRMLMEDSPSFLADDDGAIEVAAPGEGYLVGENTIVRTPACRATYASQALQTGRGRGRRRARSTSGRA